MISIFEINFTFILAHRLVREPFILFPKEGFVRFDSGKLRFYGETQDWVMQNSAFQALIKFKAFMMYKVPSSPRDGMDENRIYNHIGFFARTGVTKNLSGEVAPEGKEKVFHTVAFPSLSPNIEIYFLFRCPPRWSKLCHDHFNEIEKCRLEQWIGYIQNYQHGRGIWEAWIRG